MGLKGEKIRFRRNIGGIEKIMSNKFIKWNIVEDAAPEHDGTYFVMGENINGVAARGLEAGNWEKKQMNEDVIAYGSLKSDLYSYVSTRKEEAFANFDAETKKRAHLDDVSDIIVMVGEKKSPDTHPIVQAVIRKDGTVSYSWIDYAAMADEAVMYFFDKMQSFVEKRNTRHSHKKEEPVVAEPEPAPVEPAAETAMPAEPEGVQEEIHEYGAPIDY